MSNEDEISNEQSEEEAARIALQSMVDTEIKNKEKQKEEEAAKLRDIKITDIVTKADLNAALEKIAKDQEALKTLLLKAKAQGKATINQQSGDKMSELKRIYGDLIDF